jgi:anaerobic selenocysteine-containing dehydrogenase
MDLNGGGKKEPVMEIKRSVCPHDCPDTCGLVVGLEDGRVISVKGDPEHPFTRGTVCVKVAQYPERTYSSLRVLHPLKRKGPKGSGQFERITWDEALDEVVSRFRKSVDEYGSEAILPYSYGGTLGIVQRNAGHPFFYKLGATKLLRTICSAAAEAGFSASLGSTPTTDIESTVHSDLIIIWGNNTISTNIHAWPFFMKARRNGASIVVIDPYRNRTARLADRHLKVKPGTDAALALGVMNVLINEELIDRRFISDHSVGFEELCQRVQEYPPSRVEGITSVSASEIEQLARQYGRARAPYIRTGWGPSRQLRGAMAIRTIALLPALVGALHKRGGGITRGKSRAFAFNSEVVTRDDLGPQGVRTLNMVQLGNALTEVDDPPVKGFYVYHSNPAVVAPDSGKVLAGLAREDLFTVVHEQLMTQTALFADIVLPATTFLEHTDVYGSYGHYYLQMARPVISPVGEARSNLAVFQEMAGRFGFDEECFTTSEEDIIRKLLDTNSPNFEGITFERVAECRPVRLNVPENPFATVFNTPSGKVEFYSQSLAEQGLDPLPDGTPSVDIEGEGRYPLQMITPPRHHFLNSSFNEIDRLRDRAGKPSIMIHPDDGAARKISEGELVRIFNDRGDCFLYADLTEDTARGVTVVEGIYWPRFMPGTRGANQLTSQRLGDMGQSCAFHCNLIEVEKTQI